MSDPGKSKSKGWMLLLEFKVGKKSKLKVVPQEKADVGTLILKRSYPARTKEEALKEARRIIKSRRKERFTTLEYEKYVELIPIRGEVRDALLLQLHKDRIVFPKESRRRAKRG